MSVATTWGTSPEERELAFPGDLIERPQAELFRGIAVDASPATTFRWLCQLRVAPYSYDRLDNSGAQSPRELTPGLDDLVLGQRFMSIFTLQEFEPDHHIVVRLNPEAKDFGRFVEDLVICYLLVPRADGCRLLAKFTLRYSPGPLGMLARVGLPWGDLLMARKQLMTLRDLAESADS